MPTSQTPAAPGKATRWLLIASLAFNFLIVGAVAGLMLSGGPRRGGPPGEKTIGAIYIDAFERSDKRAMRSEMRAQLPPRDKLIANHRADFARFIKLLRAENFDRDMAAQVIDGQMQRSTQVLQLGRSIALDRIAAMSPAERRAYADRMQERAEMFGRRGKHRKKPPHN